MTKAILSKIEKLATRTAEEAAKPDAKLGERIEALKVLQPFWSLLKKDRPPEEDTDTTMKGLQAQLEEAESNGSEIQHRRRGRPANA